MTQDQAVAAETHDALWAVLWNRRYDDVDEPLWLPDATYSGILAYARILEPETTLLAVDSGEAFVVFRGDRRRRRRSAAGCASCPALASTGASPR